MNTEFQVTCLKISTLTKVSATTTKENKALEDIHGLKGSRMCFPGLLTMIYA
jgi:hypothetical protein